MTRHRYKVKTPISVSVSAIRYEIPWRDKLNRLVPDTPTSMSKISRDSKESTPVPDDVPATVAVVTKRTADPIPQVINTEKKPLTKESSHESDSSFEDKKPVVVSEFYSRYSFSIFVRNCQPLLCACWRVFAFYQRLPILCIYVNYNLYA